MTLVISTPSSGWFHFYRYAGTPKPASEPRPDESVKADSGVAESGKVVRRTERAWSPSISVARAEDLLTFRLEADGVRPEDLDVNVAEGYIEFTGEKQEVRNFDRQGYEWHEISRRTFMRTLPLPETAEWKQAEAAFAGGKLVVTVPLAAGPEALRIPIRKAGKGAAAEAVTKTAAEADTETVGKTVEAGGAVPGNGPATAA
jgi:HSP20 family molecular chaperone IbpA